MSDLSVGWRGTIDQNLVLLSECTGVNSELTTFLYENKLITRSEFERLKNPAFYGSNHERAIDIYAIISKRWEDVCFEKFKKGLSKSCNQRAWNILNERQIENPRVDPLWFWRIKKFSLPASEYSCWSRELPYMRTLDNLIIWKHNIKYSPVTPLRVPEIKSSEKEVDSPSVDCKKIFHFSNVEIVEVGKQRGRTKTEQRMKVENPWLKKRLKSRMSCYRYRFIEGVDHLRKESVQKKATLRGEIKLLENSSISVLDGSDNEPDALKESVEDTDKQAEDEEVNPTLEDSTVKTLEVWRVLPSRIEKLDMRVFEQRFPAGESHGGLEGDMEQVETKASKWELGDLKAFEFKKAKGSWFWIGGFHCTSHFSPPGTCEEYMFSVKGTSIAVTNWFKDAGEEKEINFDLSVDTFSPHQWIKSDGAIWRWLGTDYVNWGVLKWSSNKEVACGDTFFILSRTTHLQENTLEVLGDVAKTHGFLKTNGFLIEQTTC